MLEAAHRVRGGECVTSGSARPRRAPRRRRDGPGPGQDEGVAVADSFRTARIWATPFRQVDACPVASTSGVANPWHTHPCIFTGAPPPLPGTLPDASARA